MAAATAAGRKRKKVSGQTTWRSVSLVRRWMRGRKSRASVTTLRRSSCSCPFYKARWKIRLHQTSSTRHSLSSWLLRRILMMKRMVMVTMRRLPPARSRQGGRHLAGHFQICCNVISIQVDLTMMRRDMAVPTARRHLVMTLQTCTMSTCLRHMRMKVFFYLAQALACCSRHVAMQLITRAGRRTWRACFDALHRRRVSRVRV
mmetsp:Transcript_10921/g.18328  ORF Transcript_10921/g.18328 Transcript_10921/m.18328 type:complete len:203 (+) Transcript_10921:145-753(+)